MTVKIINCGNKAFWYQYKIGCSFTVDEHGADYRVTDGPYAGNGIAGEDCEVVR